MTKLAPGITVLKGGAIHIDPDIAYPDILKAIGAPEKLDQYWVEVAYQCAKLEVQRLIHGTKHDPRPDGALRILIESRKDTWALSNFPEGRGEMAASKGGEAREHYKRWRGFVPDGTVGEHKDPITGESDHGDEPDF